MFLRVLLISLLLAACAGDASLDEPSDKSVEITTEYPSVVKVLSRQFCTGVVVSPRAVLTAAHCLKGSKQAQVRTTDSQYEADSWEILGSSSTTSDDDVALVILSEAVTELAEFPKIGTEAKTKDRVTLVGFGCTDVSDRKGVGVKRAGTNRIETVGKRIEFSTPLKEKTRRILGPSNRAGSCFGDSGGPLFLDGKVVGLVHSGIYYDEKHVSSYTNITRSDVQTWLRELNDKHQLGMSWE